MQKDMFELGDENISDDSNDFYQFSTTDRRSKGAPNPNPNQKIVDSSKFDRFNSLYQRAMQLKQKQEIRSKQIDPNCTFKPNVINKRKKSIDMLNEYMQEQDNNGSTSRRVSTQIVNSMKPKLKHHHSKSGTLVRNDKGYLIR